MASSTAERTFTVRSPEDLERLAAALAANLRAGDRIALYGDLGAGKTVFVRGLARGLGHPDPRDVVSPTFAIHNRYDRGRLTLDHLDLYRLPPPVRPEREGLEPVMTDPQTVLCCEWADRLGRPLAEGGLEVRIAFVDPGTRIVTFRAPEGASQRFFHDMT